jgi:hypothetical protein
MKRFAFLVLFTLTLILAACIPSQANTDQTLPQTAAISPVTPTANPSVLPTLYPNTAGNGEMTRTDEQGAVVIEVTPINLGTSADQLEFDVSMNTHSFDLSMDLATLATLTTDTSITIQPTLWDAPGGGHHVSGKLIFPSMKGGKSILEGASKLTLTIINVDAPSRLFEWELK